MRIFIPTKNRHETIQTHKYFNGFDYHILVHNQQQYDLYEKFAPQTGIDIERLEITDVAPDQFGLTRQREWVCGHFAAKDEWFIFADDNIKEIQAVASSHYNSNQLPVQAEPTLKSIYEQRCEPERFINEIVPECIGFAEKAGANHLGFACVDNFFFRANKWKQVAYIIGKLMLWHNTGELKFDHTITMEDFELTAQSLLKFGIAPVNNFVYPVASHYQKGGMGRKDERMNDRWNDVQILMQKYPGLFAMKNSGYPDLKLKFYAKQQVEQWRKHFTISKTPKSMWS